MPTAGQIHFYEVEETVPEKGWVHYTSRVPGWEGVDARVADVVRSEEDLSGMTIGFLNAPTGSPTPETVRLLGEEAVRISRFAPTWLDRIMTRSPFRDHDLWRARLKATYLKHRRERRARFLAGTLVFPNPNSPPALADGSHKHGAR
jgi:hypothetical protein